MASSFAIVVLFSRGGNMYSLMQVYTIDHLSFYGSLESLGMGASTDSRQNYKKVKNYLTIPS
jgi:hypothetical protein